jgi:hypothetical protein
MTAEFVNRFGYIASTAPSLDVVELACALRYTLPCTPVLGAIL